MVKEDENALICDLMETYGIYEYRQLPARRVAVFSVGLGDSSRIKRKLTGQKISNMELLLALAVDRLSLLVWLKTKDGAKGRNRPESILTALMSGPKKEKEKEFKAFRNGKEFEEYRRKLLGGVNDG